MSINILSERSLGKAFAGAKVRPRNSRVLRIGSAAQLAEGGGVILGEYASSPRGRYRRASHTCREIESLFRHRYPIEHGVVPTTRAMGVAFAELIAVHANESVARAWISRNLVKVGELDEREADDILGYARTMNQFWSDDEVAAHLEVTRAERDALGLTAIGAIDFSQEQRKAERLRKDRERKRTQRAKAKCGTVQPIPAERAKPWKAEGISRRTWYRRRANVAKGRGTDSVRNNIYKDSNEFDADKKSATRVATLATRIIALLAEPRSVRELCELTGKPATTIRPILSRLKANGKAASVERGVWQAIETGGPKAAAHTSPDQPRTTCHHARLPDRDNDRQASARPTSVDRVAAILRAAIVGMPTNGLARSGRALARRPLVAMVEGQDVR